MLLLGFAVGAFLFFFLQGGVPGLPTSPFGKSEERISLIEEASVAERRLLARYPQLRPRRREPGTDELTVRLRAHDLRDLALAGLARDPDGERLLHVSRALDVEIGDGEVGIELLVSLEEVPNQLLTDKERERMKELEDWMMFLGSELPIGVYGRPEANEGRIRLGGQPRVEVSIIKLSIDTVSDRLGMTRDELEESLELEWPGYEVLDVIVEEGEIELVVRTA